MAARLLISWIFIVDGLEAMRNYGAVGAYMEANGVDKALLPIVVLTLFGGGLFMAAGLFTRTAAAALAGFCLLTAILFHQNIADPGEWIQFNKDVAIAGGFLAFVALGGGSISFDALLTQGKRARGGLPGTADMSGRHTDTPEKTIGKAPP